MVKMGETESGEGGENVSNTKYGTIAVDFDGTLCENSFPEIGEPKPLVIAFVKEQSANGSKIILHTCRENGTRRAYLDEAIEFCAEHGILLYAVNESPDSIYNEDGITGRKVYADLYIDDRAISAADVEKLQKSVTPNKAGLNIGKILEYAKQPRP